MFINRRTRTKCLIIFKLNKRSINQADENYIVSDYRMAQKYHLVPV